MNRIRSSLSELGCTYLSGRDGSFGIVEQGGRMVSMHIAGAGGTEWSGK